MPSLESIIYGIVCAIVIMIAGFILTPLLQLDSIVTTLGSLTALVIPPIAEKLAEKKTDVTIETITLLTQEIKELKKQINDLENDIIEIKSLLSCYPLAEMKESIGELNTEIKILLRIANHKI